MGEIIWLDFNDAPNQQDATAQDTDTLRQDLLDRLEAVLLYLFPHGRIRGNKFHVGDVDGNPGKSLVVELEGERRGLWKDFATNDGGDVIDLWASSRGLSAKHDFPKVVEEIRQWLGLAPPASRARPTRQRGAPIDELGPYTAKWDYLTADGQLIACVYRFDPPTGKEYRPWDVRARMWRAPEPRPLYNLPGIKDAAQVVLVEGEKSAQALIDIGIAATTAMNGANAPVEKTDWTPLADKHVLVWPDRDKPGWDYAMAAAQAALDAGAASCVVLLPPDDKPEGWDAADAMAEGFDVHTFIASGPRIGIKAGKEEQPAQEASVWATDDALALSFTQRYGEDWSYCAAWGKWLVWDGQRWRTDDTLLVHHLIRAICREAALKADSHRLAAKIASANTIGGVERMARADRRHATTAEDWDADPWRLNTPGGVVDLRTGQIRPHQRADRMTKITTATPRGDCPRWRAFLADVTGGDDELQAYLQRMIGYCLTGSTAEHALFFLYGTGANGKSVFANTLTTILGDYATNAPMDTFMEARGDRHPTELAGLRGARIVTSIETEQDRRWNESRIKAITGGDKISARFMRQDFFEYTPHFKLVIAGNHKPAIRNVDEAMKRRLHLIPFTVTIPPERRDRKLTEKLLAERDGILAWAVQGCLEWQREGLKPPAVVVSATEEYFEEEDAIGDFLHEEAQLHPRAKVAIAEVFQRWQEWAIRRGEYVGNSRWIVQQLINRGFERTRLNDGAKALAGFSLKSKNYGTNLPYRDD